MLDLVTVYSSELLAAGITLLGWIGSRIFRMKPKLQYGVGHSFDMIVDEPLRDAEGNITRPTQMLRTASISVTNAGLMPATNVEVTFNWKPACFNVWPIRHFGEAKSAYDRYTIKLDTLAPKEQFNIEIMAINQELPALTNVRCQEQAGVLVPTGIQRLMPTWFNVAVTAVFTLGLVTIAYWVIVVVDNLLIKT